MCEHIEECISAENRAVSAFGSLCWCAHQHKIPNTGTLPVHQHSWLRPSTSQQSCPAPVPLVWPHWDWSWWGPAGTGSVWRPATSCALPWCLVCVKDEWEGWHLVPRPGPSCGERWVWALQNADSPWIEPWHRPALSPGGCWGCGFGRSQQRSPWWLDCEKQQASLWPVRLCTKCYQEIWCSQE